MIQQPGELPDCFTDAAISDGEDFFGFSMADVLAERPSFDEEALDQFEEIFGFEGADDDRDFLGFLKNDM